MSLNDLVCRHAKAKPTTYKLTDENGLFLEIRPSGVKSWRFRYTFYSREKTLTIGNYPHCSLNDARNAREIAREQLKNGIDPSLAKQEAKLLAQYQHAQTLELVTREWIDRNADQWNKKTREIILRRFEIYIFPLLGQYPIGSIPQSVLQTCLEKTEKHSADVATRLLKYLKKIFRYAGRTGRTNGNPAEGLEDVIKKYKRGHHPSIDVNELPTLLEHLQNNKLRLYRETILAIYALMLTGLRTNELVNAEKTEFYFEHAQWIIPAARMKMKQDHIVPLSSQLVKIIKELFELSGNSKFLLPSKRRKGKPISLFTINTALKRMGYKRKMTGHGFRTLFLGISKEKLNFPHDIPDRQLAHVPKGTNGPAYDRASLLPQRTELMQKVSDYVFGLISPPPQRSINDRYQLTFKPQQTGGTINYRGSAYTIEVQQINFRKPHSGGHVPERT